MSFCSTTSWGAPRKEHPGGEEGAVGLGGFHLVCEIMMLLRKASFL